VRRAFTLVELIIVIVLLGILGVMSTDIIAHTYRNYVYQKEIADLQSRSKQMLDQLGVYLERSLKPSVARYDGINHRSIWGLGVTDANLSNGNYLEWIGKDTESLRGIWDETKNRIYPGYSGLANVRDSNGTFVITTDCNLSVIDTTQEDITDVPDSLDGLNATPRAALYFVYANSDGDVSQHFWVNPASLFGIAALDGPNGIITLDSMPPEIGEQYYLTYSAYGIQLEADGTMWLYWNFRPWNGETVTAGTKLLLMENVTSFEYWSESEDTILRLKVCLGIPGDDETTFCKETVVLR
jgi:prepilin-type N-terminal cleavage/methylation domain-containing protein